MRKGEKRKRGKGRRIKINETNKWYKKKSEKESERRRKR